VTLDRYLHIFIMIKDILHPDIIKHCYDLFEKKFYSDAAGKAMRQVEIVLKKASPALKSEYGKRLIKKAFSGDSAIILALPLKGNKQKDVQQLFESAFSVYRNPLHHENHTMGKSKSGRVLAIASELVYLIDQSTIIISDLNGMSGYIYPENGVFKNYEQLIASIEFYRDQWAPEDAFDGYWEDLVRAGISDEQELVLFSLGIITTEEQPIVDDRLDFRMDFITTFLITDLGEKILSEAKQKILENSR